MDTSNLVLKKCVAAIWHKHFWKSAKLSETVSKRKGSFSVPKRESSDQNWAKIKKSKKWRRKRKKKEERKKGFFFINVRKAYIIILVFSARKNQKSVLYFCLIWGTEGVLCWKEFFSIFDCDKKWKILKSDEGVRHLRI